MLLFFQKDAHHEDEHFILILGFNNKLHFIWLTTSHIKKALLGLLRNTFFPYWVTNLGILLCWFLFCCDYYWECSEWLNCCTTELDWAQRLRLELWWDTQSVPPTRLSVRALPMGPGTSLLVCPGEWVKAQEHTTVHSGLTVLDDNFASFIIGMATTYFQIRTRILMLLAPGLASRV